MKTIACMVLVSDERLQTELEAWMRDIGHYVRAGKGNGARFLVFDSAQNEGLWLQLNDSAQKIFARDFIDCGTDIELFKALAAMNDKNDREQWFTDTADGFSKCSVDRWLDEWQPEYHDRYSIWRKATVEEIVEHFKTRQ